MSRNRRVAIVFAVFIVSVGLLAVAARQQSPVAGAATTPTPYHEGFPSPEATPHAMPPSLYPLPAAEDVATANTMATGSTAMIQAAAGMSRAAQTMVASGDPTLSELANHWEQDARALREQGAWMVLAATADSMVHDPDKAREVNLQNLRGNGMSMAAEGQAMVEHGNEMAAEVDRLRRDGALNEAMADELTADARALVTAGESLVQDGEWMQEYAKRLLQSIGR